MKNEHCLGLQAFLCCSSKQYEPCVVVESVLPDKEGLQYDVYPLASTEFVV